jgi:hypothetical protein
MNETTDLNLAAFLVFKGHRLDYRAEDQGGRVRVYFSFPGLTADQFKSLKIEYLNSEIQHFTDAQRTVKNVVRNLAV